MGVFFWVTPGSLTGKPVGLPVSHLRLRGLSIGIYMRNFKISPSQLTCLALALIGLTVFACSGRSHLGVLIPISIGICMPFYSLAYTGHFTYLPKVKRIETPIPITKQVPQPTKTNKPRITTNGSTKEYDLRDIPYPPKRKGDQPRSCLPYGNGLSLEKQATKAIPPRCALLGPKPETPSDNRNPETPVGATLPLFHNAEPLSTHKIGRAHV